VTLPGEAAPRVLRVVTLEDARRCTTPFSTAASRKDDA
jgi:hypothetical protein